MNSTLQSSQKRIRPGWVSAITIWHFGWFAILLLFMCLIYTGTIHLNPGSRARLDSAVAHAPVSAYLIGLTNLIGSGFLFYLRKLAFYMFCAGLAVRVFEVVVYLMANGWGLDRISVWQCVSLLVGVIFCAYARSLVARGILV